MSRRSQCKPSFHRAYVAPPTRPEPDHADTARRMLQDMPLDGQPALTMRQLLHVLAYTGRTVLLHLHALDPSLVGTRYSTLWFASAQALALIHAHEKAMKDAGTDVPIELSTPLPVLEPLTADDFRARFSAIEGEVYHCLSLAHLSGMIDKARREAALESLLSLTQAIEGCACVPAPAATSATRPADTAQVRL